MFKENVDKYRNDFQAASQEIKELKEKVKGNMSLIQAREILWNDIIHTVTKILESLFIVEEENIIIKYLESFITTNKEKLHQRA